MNDNLWDRYLGLTLREKEVVALLMEGFRNRQIAAALGCKKNTVIRHVVNICNAIGAGSRVEIVVMLRECKERELREWDTLKDTMPYSGLKRHSTAKTIAAAGVRVVEPSAGTPVVHQKT